MTIDGSDNLVPVERKKIIIPQLGNKPGGNPSTKGHKSPACRGKQCITYGHWTVTSLVEVREHGFLGSSVGRAPEA